MEPLDYSIIPDRYVTYGTFWQRLVAAIIDSILVGLVLWLADWFVFNNDLLGTVFNVVVQWLYYALQEAGVNQATIGKRALNIKVTDLNGGRISFMQATIRYFSKILSAVILFIGYLMMLWDDRKQTLHDKLANTLVVAEQ